MAIGFRNANSSNGATTAGSVTLPTGTVAGDVVVWIIEVYSGAITWSDPAGWTNFGGVDYYQGTVIGNVCVKAYYKISDGTETPSVTFSDSRNWTMSIASYSGCDQSVPIDPTEGVGWSKVTGGTGAVTTTALTASTGQWLVGMVGAADSSTTVTWTDNRTERTDKRAPAFGATTTIADSNGTVTGSVTTVFTPSEAIEASRGVAVLLNPPTGNANPTAGVATAATVAYDPPSPIVYPIGVSGNWILVKSDEFDAGSLDTTLWRPGWFGDTLSGPANSSETAGYSNAANITFAGDGAVHLSGDQYFHHNVKGHVP